MADDDSGAVAVRRARREDVAGLVALCQEHAEFEGVMYDRTAKAGRLASAVFSPSPRLFAWVAATRQQNIIGYATAAREYSTWDACEHLHMDCLFVRADGRGAGIGADLLMSVVVLARELGCAEMQWQTPHWNDHAARFYRRHGAVDRHKLRFVLNLAEQARSSNPAPRDAP